MLTPIDLSCCTIQYIIMFLYSTPPNDCGTRTIHFLVSIVFGKASNRVINEMVVDGGGHSSPAGIDGVHTCLYYYRPIQHIAVLRVIQYNTYTDIQ